MFIFDTFNLMFIIGNLLLCSVLIFTLMFIFDNFNLMSIIDYFKLNDHY